MQFIHLASNAAFLALDNSISRTLRYEFVVFLGLSADEVGKASSVDAAMGMIRHSIYLGH